MTGRVLLVTGGSRGIGRAVVLGAARQGYEVALCGRSRGDLERTASEARSLGARVLARVADVASEDAIEDFVDDVLDDLGRLDVVVHNAAVQRDGLAVRTSQASFAEVMRVNLTAAFVLARRAGLEFLAQGEGGRIINVGSISQQGATSQAVYAASKGALGGLTKTLAKELGGRGVTANLIVPGLVDGGLSKALPETLRTAMIDRTPLRRAGTPDEVAAGVLWLASPEASYVNGAELWVSGGLFEVQW